MLGNSVKDVRNVNHLQSVLLCHWLIFPPPGQLKNFDVHSFSLSTTLFICCAWHVTFSGLLLCKMIPGARVTSEKVHCKRMWLPLRQVVLVVVISHKSPWLPYSLPDNFNHEGFNNTKSKHLKFNTHVSYEHMHTHAQAHARWPELLLKGFLFGLSSPRQEPPPLTITANETHICKDIGMHPSFNMHCTSF